MDQRSRGQPQTVITNHKPSRGQGSRQNSHIPQSRMQFPQSPHPRQAINGRISTIQLHDLKCLEGNCMRNISPLTRSAHTDCGGTYTLTMRPSAASPRHNSPVRYGTPGTKLAQHTPTNTTPGTKLTQHTVKRPIWALFRVQGEFIHACGSNKPSMRISLAHAASFEARHPAPNLHAPNMAAPLIGRRSPTYGRRPSRPPIRRQLMNPVATDRTGMKENTPMRELFQGTLKHYSPRHAQRDHFSTVLSARGRFLFQRGVMPRTRAPCWGGISFTRTRLGQ